MAPFIDPRLQGKSELGILQALTDSQRILFQIEMNATRKDIGTVRLITLLTGAIGGHYFYLGYKLRSMLALLFCWTFVPSLITLLELLTSFVNEYVTEANQLQAQLIGTKVLLMDPLPTNPADEQHG